MFCCFECGQPADHAHHIVPRSLGGTRTVPLCEVCHGKVHDVRFLNHSALTKAGLARAKRAGKHCGRPGRSDYDLDAAQALLGSGKSQREVARILDIPLTTLQRHLRKAATVRAAP